MSNPTKSVNIQSLNPLDYRTFPVEVYSQQKKFGERFENYKNADLVTSLGCPHNCDYCSTKRMWPDKFRTYSSLQLDFMLDTIQEAGYDFISVQDDNLAANPEHAKLVISKLKERNLPWHWEGGIEVNIFDRIIDYICNSTCKMVDMAIETYARTNDIYDKFSSKTERLLRYELEKLQKSGIFVNSSFMIGLPNEGKEEPYNTAHYAKSLKDYGLIDHANFHIMTAYPGTMLSTQDYEKPRDNSPEEYFGYAAAIGNIPNPNYSRKELITLRNDFDKHVNGILLYEKKRREKNRY